MNSPMGKSWQLLLAACLAVLMSITRSNYFDWAALLPSASLAIFFLVGFYLIWRCARLADERYVRVRLNCGIKLFAVALLSISGAFVISNGSFYAFSGNFSDLSLLDYSVRVERYYLTYLTDPLIYLAVAALVHTVLNSIAHRSSSTDLETLE
jgi:hypothetical protein